MSQLAIVIPYYKIDFFEETLKSIAQQNNRDFVVYIGNDASPDDPNSLVDEYLKNTTFKYFEYKDNLGGRNLALQWERILTNVKEEWFQILGDDDMLQENFVQEFYNSLPNLTSEKINVMKFPINIIDEKNVCNRQFSFKEDIIDREDFLISKIEHLALSSLSENIFRTASYKKHGIRQFPLAWHSDDCMIFEFADNHKVLYNQNTSVLIRMSGMNISSQTDNLTTKTAATNDFYNYIIRKYYHFFQAKQKQTIIQHLQKHYYRTSYNPGLKMLGIIFFDNPINFLKLIKNYFRK